MNDEELNNRLNEWRVDPPVPDSFRHDVWRRIEEDRLHTIPGAGWNVIQAFLESMQRPVFAIAMILLLAMGGLGAGMTLGNISETNHRESLKQHYLASINPLNPQRMTEMQ